MFDNIGRKIKTLASQFTLSYNRTREMFAAGLLAGAIAAKAVIDAYLGRLSSACASIFNILDPEVLAIGGGVCGAGDFLFEPLQQLVTDKCFYKTRGKLVPAVMGNDAGVIGAAMLRRDAEE